MNVYIASSFFFNNMCCVQEDLSDSCCLHFMRNNGLKINGFFITNEITLKGRCPISTAE